MGYYIHGDYIPDLGWCDGCGRGMGGNSIERYLHPRGSNYIRCKTCFEDVFADRPDGDASVAFTPKHVFGNSDDKVRWSRMHQGIIDDQYVMGGIVHCDCKPDAKYVQGYTGYLDGDEGWNLFGSGKCRHNNSDARSEAFKQHCDAIDTGQVSRFIERYETMRKFAVRRINLYERWGSEKGRGELACNKLWEKMTKA